MYKRLVPPIAAAILILAAACVPIGKNNEEAKGAVMLHADRKYDVGIEAGMISGGPAEQNEKQEGSVSGHTDSGEAVLLTLSDVMAMADDPQAVEAERAFYKERCLSAIRAPSACGSIPAWIQPSISAPPA